MFFFIGKPHRHCEHPDYVPIIFPPVYLKKNPPCRRALHRHVTKAVCEEAICSTEISTAPAPQSEVELQLLQRQEHLRKEGDILMKQFMEKEQQQQQLLDKELTEIERAHEKRLAMQNDFEVADERRETRTGELEQEETEEARISGEVEVSEVMEEQK